MNRQKANMAERRGGRPAKAVALLLLVALAPGLALGLGGCLGRSGQVATGGTVSVVTPDFFGLGEDLAHQLVGNLRSGGRPAGTRLILTSLVDLDDLERSSRFGRALSEALATQLFRRGFEVEELRKTDTVMIRNPTGELALSRDVDRLAREHRAHGLVAGTYALTPGTVIVNVRLLDAASQSVLSVAGIEIQRSAAINSMLTSGGGFGLRDGELSGYER